MESPKPRRWYQFSLRTLLIVVTVAAVACFVFPTVFRLFQKPLAIAGILLFLWVAAYFGIPEAIDYWAEYERKEAEKRRKK